MVASLCRAVLLVLACTWPWSVEAGAPPQWARATSTHFQVLAAGASAAADARTAAARLEEFRQVLEAATSEKAPDDERVQVVVFEDRQAFDAVVPRHEGRPVAADGFYYVGGGQAVIAAHLSDQGAFRFDSLFHEYAHVFLSRVLPAQPVWASEGLADFYGTWEKTPEGARIGRAPEQHLRALRNGATLPMADLLAVDHLSKAYREGEHRPLLYATSWALVHALVAGRGGDGWTPLVAVLADLSRGLPAVTAIATRFGPRFLEETTLLAYGLSAGRSPITIAVPWSTAPETVAAPASPAESAAQRANLLLHSGRHAEAGALLREAITAEPGYVAAHEGLAQLALVERRFAEARTHAARALALQPRSAAARVRRAQALLREAAQRTDTLTQGEEDEVAALLEEAVALAPYDADANEMLARLRPQPIAKRLAQLQAALARNPGRADLAIGMANLHLMRNDHSRAAAALRRARVEARDETTAFLATHALSRVTAMGEGRLEVEGVLVALECLGQGSLLFLVEAGGRVLRLAAASPTAVFLYAADGQPLERSLTCGPQALHVTGWYRRHSMVTGADGSLLSLTFANARPRAR